MQSLSGSRKVVIEVHLKENNTVQFSIKNKANVPLNEVKQDLQGELCSVSKTSLCSLGVCPAP